MFEAWGRIIQRRRSIVLTLGRGAVQPRPRRPPGRAAGNDWTGAALGPQNRRMTIARADPPLEAGEREMLNSWLEFHRATLAWKCDGLTDGQLRQRSAPPSSLSLLGLVRHMAEVERGWFRRTLAGEEVPPIYYSPGGNPDGDFDDIGDADVAGDFATWRAECEAARKAEAAAASLDVTATEQRWAWRRPAAGPAEGRRVSLRWILVHLIEEYARHNGHADLLRERIDGVTGD